MSFGVRCVIRFCILGVEHCGSTVRALSEHCPSTLQRCSNAAWTSLVPRFNLAGSPLQQCSNLRCSEVVGYVVTRSEDPSMSIRSGWYVAMGRRTVEMMWNLFNPKFHMHIIYMSMRVCEIFPAWNHEAKGALWEDSDRYLLSFPCSHPFRMSTSICFVFVFPARF